MQFQIQSILAAAFVSATFTWSVASAVGCYPSYSAGTKYSVGSWVSTSVTTTTPITYTSCSPAGSGSCPATGYKQEGGESTTASYNFQCISNDWCSQSGFAPGGTYSSTAWTQESTACTGTATLAPTNSPVYSALTSLGGCPAAFAAGTAYEAGDRVAVNKIVYACKAWPYNQFCSKSEYKPDPTAATGLDYWTQAWEVVGYCTGTIAPAAATLSPTTAQFGGGCPVEWAVGNITKYKENDRVTVTKTTTPLVKVVYKCKAWPYSGYCGQFSPLHASGGSLGWTLVGGCDGTISPTVAPTFASGSVSTGCPAEYNAAKTDYKTNDQVTTAISGSTTHKMVYKCREWPNEGYCNQKQYAPEGQYSDMAWTKVGPCTGTFAPTNSPTAFTGACKYIKVVTTTPTPTPTVIDVAGWSAGTLYDAGDLVRIGSMTYQCKPWPFYFWCRMSAYQPKAGSTTGLWTEAWTEAGPCQYVSLPPTSAPTYKPTSAPSQKPTSAPSRAPTNKPTSAPSKAPTSAPSKAPTSAPSSKPTGT